MPSSLCVEPVLGCILDVEIALDSFTSLRCYTPSSVYPVNLLVITFEVDQLQPWNATKTIGSAASIFGCDHLGGNIDMYRTEVDFISL